MFFAHKNESVNEKKASYSGDPQHMHICQKNCCLRFPSVLVGVMSARIHKASLKHPGNSFKSFLQLVSSTMDFRPGAEVKQLTMYRGAPGCFLVEN